PGHLARARADRDPVAGDAGERVVGDLERNRTGARRVAADRDRAVLEVVAHDAEGRVPGARLAQEDDAVHEAEAFDADRLGPAAPGARGDSVAREDGLKAALRAEGERLAEIDLLADRAIGRDPDLVAGGGAIDAGLQRRVAGWDVGGPDVEGGTLGRGGRRRTAPARQHRVPCGRSDPRGLLHRPAPSGPEAAPPEPRQGRRGRHASYRE